MHRHTCTHTANGAGTAEARTAGVVCVFAGTATVKVMSEERFGSSMRQVISQQPYHSLYLSNNTPSRGKQQPAIAHAGRSNANMRPKTITAAPHVPHNFQAPSEESANPHLLERTNSVTSVYIRPVSSSQKTETDSHNFWNRKHWMQLNKKNVNTTDTNWQCWVWKKMKWKWKKIDWTKEVMCDWLWIQMGCYI